MKKIVLTICFIILVVASLRASDWGTVRFTGKVTDSDGKPVKDATVLINQISGAAIGGDGMKGKALFNYMDSLKTLTDTNGAYDLSLQYCLTDSTNVRCELWLPQVTTVGLPTRGASGNPQRYNLAGTGVTAIFSRWVDLMPDGQIFEGKGISPDVIVDEPSSAYEQQDPTLEKALEILRQKITK